MNPTETQIRAHEAYKAHGYSLNDTAVALNVSLNALKKTLFNGHLKGLTIPTEYCQHLPAGMQLNAASVYVSKNGEVSGWYKGSALKHDPDDFAEFLKKRTPISNFKAPKLKNCNKNLMLEWPIYDSHHGMLAWGKETGNDYDTKISRHLQVSAGKIIAQSFGRVKRLVILLGGDNQTIDNFRGVTEKSGNAVDRDSRYAKMAWVTHEACVSSIEIGCSIADEVHVVPLPGNHDESASVHLAIQLHSYFRKNKKVTIDTSPEPHKFYKWGCSVFMGTHGEGGEKNLGTFMLNNIIERGLADQNTKFKLVRMGHLHQRGKKILAPTSVNEDGGVIIERFPTLAAQEAYSIKGFYTSVRATGAVLWHKDYGRYGGREITVGEILDRHPVS